MYYDPSFLDPDDPICWFDLLDDLTILKILNYLCPSDQLKLEVVCKRWDILLRYLWTSVVEIEWAQPVSIDSLDFQGPKRSKITLRCSHEKLTTLLARCSSNLNQLYVALASESHFGLEIIAKNCPALRTLGLKEVSISSEDVRAIIPLALQLRDLTLDNSPLRFSMEGCQIADSLRKRAMLDPLREFFNHSSLERLQVRRRRWDQNIEIGPADLLPMLPVSLQAVELDWGGRLSQSNLLHFLQNHPNLLELNLFPTGGLLDPDLGGMPMLLQALSPRLQVLRLWRFSFLSPQSRDLLDLSNLGQLHALRQLHVNEVDFFDNQALRAVCEGCRQLEILRISDSNVQGYALKSLQTLIKLRTMDIRFLESVDGKIVALATKTLHQLADLSLDGLEFEVEDWTQLARNCPQLESIFLDPDDVDRTTEALMQDIADGARHFMNTLFQGELRGHKSCTVATTLAKATFSVMEWRNPSRDVERRWSLLWSPELR